MNSHVSGRGGQLIYVINISVETRIPHVKELAMAELNPWIEAAKKLISNPDAIVMCPECHQGTLKVIDVPIPDWNKIDRYLICDSCGAKNVITMQA